MRAVGKVHGLALLFQVRTLIVSSMKYFPWQVRHFLQCSTHFSKMCCRPITSKFLALELLFHGWKTQKSHGARSELNSAFHLEKVDQWNPIRTSAIRSRVSSKKRPSLHLHKVPTQSNKASLRTFQTTLVHDYTRFFNKQLKDWRLGQWFMHHIYDFYISKI
jgi:hypothetical protein